MSDSPSRARPVALVREIPHAAFDERLVAQVRDVLVYARAPTLGVPHLAEHASVRARDALDGEHRAIGVHVEIHRRHAIQTDVLRRDLPALDKLLERVVVGHKAPLAMADGDGMDVTHLAAREPR